MGAGTVLRELLRRGEILIAPGAYDALSARIIEQAGFDAVYLTGYGQSASHLGQPDVGLMTLTEMAARVNCIASAIDVPLICDGDTGFGNAVNVMRTVREYEKAGAAAIQLEDQVAPKRCGHMTGREVVPVEEMAAKIRAACAARRDPDLVLIARTDARTSHGLDQALARGRAYREAGADVLFIESPESEDEMKRIAGAFDVPVLANMVEGGRTPSLDAAALEELGFALAIYPVSALYLAAGAVRRLMQDLKAKGTTRDWLGEMIPFAEFNDLLGLDEVRRVERGEFGAPPPRRRTP